MTACAAKEAARDPKVGLVADLKLQELELSKKPRVTGIIAAGGSGTRLGAAGGKQLLEVAGKPIAAWAVDALAAAELIDDIVIVCDPCRMTEYAQTISASVTTAKPLSYVAGGDTREESVMAGLLSAEVAAVTGVGDRDGSSGLKDVDDDAIVVIHDGARPLLEASYVDKAIAAFIADSEIDGIVLGNPAVDTLKRVNESACVEESPARESFWHAQTPQIFYRTRLMEAIEKARTEGFLGTDDASYIEHNGGEVVMCHSSRNNIKVTSPEDLDFVELMLQKARNSC